MKYLSDFDVDKILSRYPNLITEALNETLIEHKKGHLRQSKNSLRSVDGGLASDRLTSMMGFIGKPPKVVGFKVIGSYSGNPNIGIPRASILIILCNPKTYAPELIIDGTKISLQRTAETAILGVNKLVPNAKKIAIIGTGDLAQTTLQCIQKRVTSIKDVSVYGRHDIKELGKSDSIPADVVITATSADSPILTDLNLKNVRLLINLGLREVSSLTISAFNEHIVDDFNSCAAQNTPFGNAVRDNFVSSKNVHQLSSIIDKKKIIPLEKRIYFQPSGMVAIDLLAAAKVWERSNS